MAPIRILQVLGSLDRGGIETWLVRVMRQLDPSRYRMDFLVHSDSPGAYDEEVVRLGARVHRCPSPSRPLRYARTFRRILDEHGPYDIVQSQVYLFSGIVLRLAAGRVPARIAHVHPLTDIRNGTLGRRMYRALMVRWIGRYATGIYAPSEATLRAFLALGGFSGQRTTVVPNCIELEPFAEDVDPASIRERYGLPTHLPLITYVARFAPHKNHRQLVRLADALNGATQRAHFLMIGSHGALLDDLREVAAARADVTVLDRVSEVPALLLASDLCVFPSLEEGFGVAALEAAAAGMPVIATDLESLREALPASHHDLMFRPNDDEGALAGIEAVLGDPALRGRLGRDGRSHAAGFSNVESVRRLTEAWETGLQDQAEP